MNKPYDPGMNILIVAYWHDPRFKKKAGGLIRMFELADNLLASGHQVTMVLPKLGFPKTQTRAEVVEVPFLDLPFIRPLSFHLLSSLYLLFLCLKGFDKVYVRQMNSFLPLLIARLSGIFSYFELPNDPYIGYSLDGKYKGRILRFIDNFSIWLCDRVVVLSEWSRNRLGSIGGVDPARVLVFPSGTDTELFCPRNAQDARRELGLDPSGHYVGFIGSFLAYQGVDTLIEAAAPILEKVPGTRFLLVGDGPMKTLWQEEVEKVGLQDAFIFTGHIPYREVPLYLGAMDVCIAPHFADTNQASPVKLFDYMASGRAIVASDIDVVREILAECDCAILTKPQQPAAFADAVTTLLENEKIRKEMGNCGRLYAVEKYDRRKLTKALFSA